MKKWRVAKRDGCWQACDTTGFLRYASTSWEAALSFALLGVYDRRRAGFMVPLYPQSFDAETSEELRQAIWEAIQNRRKREEDE